MALPELVPVRRQPADLTLDQMRLGIRRLGKILEDVRQFDPTSVTDQYDIPQLPGLAAAVDEALERTFGADTRDYNRYRRASNLGPGLHGVSRFPIAKVHRLLLRSKARSIGLLEQAIRGLEDHLADREMLAAASDPPYASAQPSPQAPSPKVFVVHGRDDAAKNEVALFLRAIGLEPIILHLRPNGGRHLLTKFREESEGAGFAVVLMTPDDQGGIAGGEQSPRARQNVVFELGFFIGKLGPANVAALLKGGVEKPSDFDGIAYIALDPGRDWKTELAREIRYAKVPFDTDKVLTA